jgi:hypothetical protein
MAKMFELTHGEFINSHNGAVYPANVLVVREDRTAELLAWYAGAGCSDAAIREMPTTEYRARVLRAFPHLFGNRG